MNIALLLLSMALAETDPPQKHRFVSVCKQVQNNNIYDVSPSEKSLYVELKKQYYLDDCDMLWMFIDKQERLIIKDQSIQDFSLLSGHSTVLYLNIEGNSVSQTAHLPNIPQLRYLNLKDNQLSDLKGMPNYPDLHTLIIADNQLVDITGIDQLSALKWVDLSSNEISNIWPIVKLTLLRTLYVADNNISNILPTFYMENALSLSLHNNPVRFCPRGTWTRVQGQKIDVPPFLQHYCIHLRQQEAKALFSFKPKSDAPPE